MQKKKNETTRQEMIDQVLMLSEEFGRAPKFTEFKNDPRTVGTHMVLKEFSTWNGFLTAAGITPVQGGDVNELLIEQVRDLAKKLGRTPTKKEFNQAPDTANAEKAIRRFGTWNQFVEAAGLTSRQKSPGFVKRNPCTNKEIIEQVKMLAEELGRTPTQTEFSDDPRTVGVATIDYRFGSWNKLLEKAELTLNRQFWTTSEDLIRQVQTLAAELGRTPSSEEFTRDPRTAGADVAAYRFGSWSKLLEAAGLPPIGEFSDMDLIAQVRKLADSLGRTPTRDEFLRVPDTVGMKTIDNHFGSWEQFLKAAWLEPIKTGYTDEELILQLQKLAEELGKMPKMTEFKQDPRTANTSAAIDHFGSWNQFLEAAGFTPRKVHRSGKNTSNEEIIAQVQMLATELGHVPTGVEFEQDSRTVSVCTVKNRFGSWNQFLEQAGYETRKRRHFSKAEELV